MIWSSTVYIISGTKGLSECCSLQHLSVKHSASHDVALNSRLTVRGGLLRGLTWQRCSSLICQGLFYSPSKISQEDQRLSQPVRTKTSHLLIVCQDNKFWSSWLYGWKENYDIIAQNLTQTMSSGCPLPPEFKYCKECLRVHNLFHCCFSGGVYFYDLGPHPQKPLVGLTVTRSVNKIHSTELESSFHIFFKNTFAFGV